MARISDTSFLKAFDEHADALFRHAAFRLSNRERAADLTQDTFLKAWDYIRRGEEVREWKAFLYRILNNLIIDEYRRRKEQSLDMLLEDDPAHMHAHLAVDSRAEREERLDDELLIARVRSLIPQLSEDQQVVIALRYIEGLTPQEIARQLGITENTVSVRIHRAVALLKQLCAPLNPQ